MIPCLLCFTMIQRCCCGLRMKGRKLLAWLICCVCWHRKKGWCKSLWSIMTWCKWCRTLLLVHSLFVLVCKGLLLFLIALVFCQENSEAMNFRYTLTPKQRVHTFEPKRLSPDTDLKDLRFAQLGAVLANQKRLATLPSSKHFGLAWEVLALAFILILPCHCHWMGPEMMFFFLCHCFPRCVWTLLLLLW